MDSRKDAIFSSLNPALREKLCWIGGDAGFWLRPLEEEDGGEEEKKREKEGGEVRINKHAPTRRCEPVSNSPSIRAAAVSENRRGEYAGCGAVGVT